MEFPGGCAFHNFNFYNFLFFLYEFFDFIPRICFLKMIKLWKLNKKTIKIFKQKKITEKNKNNDVYKHIVKAQSTHTPTHPQIQTCMLSRSRYPKLRRGAAKSFTISKCLLVRVEVCVEYYDGGESLNRRYFFSVFWFFQILWSMKRKTWV